MELMEGLEGPRGAEFPVSAANAWELTQPGRLGGDSQSGQQSSRQQVLKLPYWFSEHLEKARAPVDADQLARVDGPVQFLSKLLKLWRLSSNDAFRLLGFDTTDTDYLARVLAGADQFHGRDVRERIAHLVWIRATLRSLFQDIKVENEWLRESHELLGDKSPLSFMLEGSMKNLYLAREYVQSLAGR